MFSMVYEIPINVYACLTNTRRKFFSFINVCVSANTTNDAADDDDDDDKITTQATVPKSQYRQ